MNKNFKTMVAALTLLMMMLLAACGQSGEKQNEGSPDVASANETKETDTNEAEAASTEEYGSVTIQNGDRTVEFTEMPERVIVYGTHIVEILLALGLEDHIVGTISDPGAILSEYEEAYADIPHLSRPASGKMGNELSREDFLAVNPDLVYTAWDAVLTDFGVGSPEELEALGIKAYLHESSAMAAPTFEDVYEDIRKIGQIFKVEDQAEELIQSLSWSMDEVSRKIENQVGTDGEPLDVFIYDMGEDSPYTNSQVILNDLISLAGGKNIFAELEKKFAKVTWEELVDRNPDIIIIMEYGSTPVESKKEFLLNNPALADVDAIKNENFGVLELIDTYEGIRYPKGLEALAKSFYPEEFN